MDWFNCRNYPECVTGCTFDETGRPTICRECLAHPGDLQGQGGRMACRDCDDLEPHEVAQLDEGGYGLQPFPPITGDEPLPTFDWNQARKADASRPPEDIPF